MILTDIYIYVTLNFLNIDTPQSVHTQSISYIAFNSKLRLILRKMRATRKSLREQIGGEQMGSVWVSDVNAARLKHYTSDLNLRGFSERSAEFLGKPHFGGGRIKRQEIFHVESYRRPSGASLGSEPRRRL